MSFGLKNAGATYQRAIQTCLGEQISDNTEAYVDDIVVKTKNPDMLIEDLKQTFENLNNWKLNPNKCVFGVPSGQLLGFLVSNRGIEASTKQIRAIKEMGPPRCVKDVQKLIRSMAALNRFISRLSEKGLPFFKLLKKRGKFEWTEEAMEAFESLKMYLTSSPILTPPKKHKDMMLYIAATSTVVSAAIVVEREEEGHVYKVQQSVYYVSKVLIDSKI
jgi:hypothetical protein